MGEGPSIDWPGLMRLGLHDLRLRPADFWALTPAELALASGRDAEARAGLSRATLDALARRYPDKKGPGDGE